MRFADLFRQPPRDPVCKEIDQPREPRFCTTCGSRLVTRTKSTGFNRYSGEETLITWLSCPNTTKEPKVIEAYYATFLDNDIIDCVPRRKPTRRRR